VREPRRELRQRGETRVRQHARREV
jgi:hypothetical protein